MDIVKLLILVMKMAAVSMTLCDKLRLLEDFVCNPLVTQSVSRNPNSFNRANWSVGFWIKVPMLAGVNADFMALTFGSPSLPVVFEVKTFDATKYSLCIYTNCLQFTGGSMLASPTDTYLKRIGDNNWHYFMFSVRTSYAISAIITVTVDTQPSFSVTIPIILSPSPNTLIIGSGSAIVNSVCKLGMHIHRIDSFPDAHISDLGGSFDKSSRFSFPGGGFTTLYLMGNSYSYSFLNLLNPSTKRATIISERTTKISWPYPKYLYNQHHFVFERPRLTINYPGEVIPISPTDNSYSCIVSFRSQTSDMYANDCATQDSCKTVIMSFKPYIRSPKADPSFGSLGAQIEVVLATDKTNLFHISDSEPYLETSYNFPRYQGGLFNITLLYYTASVNVKNNILMDHPHSRMCHTTADNLICSVWRDLNSVLLFDDLHLTMANQNNMHFYFYMMFNEIAFLDTTEFVFENKETISNGNTYDKQIISKNSVLAKRLFNDFSNNYTTSNATVNWIENCATGLCTYCKLSVCHACIPYREVSGGNCVLCGDDFVYDAVSKKCYLETAKIEDLTSFAATINSQARFKIVVINILFNNTPNFLPTAMNHTYGVFFNSIESTNYHPLLRTYYTSNEIISEEARIKNLIAKHIEDVASFTNPANIKKNYVIVEPSTYQILNPDLVGDANNCHSPQLRFQSNDGIFGSCVKYCSSGKYYNVPTALCESCPVGCSECVSLLICTQCVGTRTLLEGVCLLP
jgi:hypothetical protein